MLPGVLEKHRTLFLIGLLVIGVIAYAQAVESPYLLTIGLFIGLYSILAMGLCLLMGYAGQISLGHQAFYGIGAYISAILTAEYGVYPWFALLIAAVVTGGVAYCIGALVLRLHGFYLAMATLAMGLIAFIAFNELRDITGGPQGLLGIPRLTIGEFVLKSNRDYYYLLWAVAIILLIFSLNVVNSRIGRALRAIHSSEVAAETLGVDIQKHKVQMFVLSALYASVAGSIYTHFMTVLNPAPFNFNLAVELFVMVIIGGLANIWGALFGAAFVMVLNEVLRAYVPTVIPNASGEHEIIVYGFIIVLVVMFLPEGLLPGLLRLVRQARRKAQGPARRPAAAEGREEALVEG